MKQRPVAYYKFECQSLLEIKDNVNILDILRKTQFQKQLNNIHLRQRDGRSNWLMPQLINTVLSATFSFIMYKLFSELKRNEKIPAYLIIM